MAEFAKIRGLEIPPSPLPTATQIPFLLVGKKAAAPSQIIRHIFISCVTKSSFEGNLKPRRGQIVFPKCKPALRVPLFPPSYQRQADTPPTHPPLSLPSYTTYFHISPLPQKSPQSEEEEEKRRRKEFNSQRRFHPLPPPPAERHVFMKD